MAHLTDRLIDRLFSRAIARRVELAVRALDDSRDLLVAGQAQRERDRWTGDRNDVLRLALEAWRDNPLARRIVSLTTQYVVGTGITLQSKHAANQAFLTEWAGHRLNRLAVRVHEWCDELTRAGNLIVLVSTDAAGMSYVRALPASQVQEIRTAPNDVEQAQLIIEKLTAGVDSARVWPIYNADTDSPLPPSGSKRSDGAGGEGRGGGLPTVAVHYAINRPVGATWSESDLAPLLKWISRYSAWLEDRARLNRFRQAFVYVVTGQFASKAERLARQAELNANPPNPGALLVKDETETWEILSPKLESHEAGEDGLAMKKTIALGAAVPIHFLAEPESATRTTAEAAGGPTYRHYEQRQEFFLWLLADVARIALRRRAYFDHALAPDEPIEVHGADISARDNAALALATSQIVEAFLQLRDRQLVDDAELLRIIYRFAGEPADVAELLKRAEKAGPATQPPGGAQGKGNRPKPGLKVDAGTGEVRP